MKIGIIAPPWVPVPPPAYGGTETMIDVMARGLDKAGHKVILFASGDSSSPVDRRWVIPKASAIEMGEFAFELQHVIHAYETMQEENVDIIHDRTLSGLIYSERFPHLKVNTASDNEFETSRKEVYARVAHRVPIVALSKRQAELAHPVPIARVIHHGKDIHNTLEGKGDGDYFVFLGQMSKWKGPARAARVAKEAGARLLIGAKMRELWEIQYFQEELKPLLSKDIEYLGEVGRDQKFDLLGHAKGLINPIQWEEPFGLSMIEAFACGTPVITFPRGAAPEIVKHGKTGFLCQNEVEMVDALGKVETLDRAACRAEVDGGEFSADRMIRDYVKFFEDHLEDKAF